MNDLDFQGYHESLEREAVEVFEKTLIEGEVEITEADGAVFPHVLRMAISGRLAVCFAVRGKRYTVMGPYQHSTFDSSHFHAIRVIIEDRIRSGRIDDYIKFWML